MSQRIEVADVFKDPSGKHRVVTMVDDGNYGRILFYEGGCFQETVCTLIRKTPPPPVADCKWVNAGWALHPTDFKMEDGKKVTAEYAGRSWDVLTEDDAAKHEWQRPRELDIDILHTMKRIKTASHKLGEQEGQKYIWEMLQATAKAAKVLSEIRDRAEAAAKTLQGGQP